MCHSWKKNDKQCPVTKAFNVKSIILMSPFFKTFNKLLLFYDILKKFWVAKNGTNITRKIITKPVTALYGWGTKVKITTKSFGRGKTYAG